MKVIKRFRDKETKKLYEKGDLYKGNKERVSHLIKKGFLADNPPLNHIGGGYYELPNGNRVKGKKQAMEALENEQE